MRIESSVTINAPVERVFDYITDVTRQPEWVGAVTAVSDISSAPVDVGTTFMLSLAMMGKTADARQEVTALESNRTFTQRTISGPVPTEVAISLESSNGVTTVHNVTEADISSLGRFAAPLVTRTIKRQLEGDMQRLREILEQG
jgi:uncharacterized membrane protein